MRQPIGGVVGACATGWAALQNLSAHPIFSRDASTHQRTRQTPTRYGMTGYEHPNANTATRRWDRP